MHQSSHSTIYVSYVALLETEINFVLLNNFT